MIRLWFVITAVLTTLLLTGRGAEAAPLTCGTWSVVPNPPITSNNAFLNGVAAVSSNNVWAVGNIGYNQTLIENWNGQQWNIVSSPNVGAESVLNAVTSVPGKNELWAVGNYFNTAWYTLIEHWNGSAWSVVPSPTPSSNNSISLGGVTAISAKDVWAVGSSYNGSITQTLIEHWDGHKWHIIQSPSPGSLYSYLSAVAAVSKNDVWAVGAYDTSSGEQSLIEHWNGHKWSVVSNPGYIGLSAITSVPRTHQLWAVGPYNVGYVLNTLIEHWDGSSWTIVPSPTPGAGFNNLTGVTAVSAKNVWAVGYYSNGEVPVQTLIEHWNGTSWSVVSSPNPSPADNDLYAVTRVPGTSQLWAVGFNAASQYNQPLTEFYC